MGAASMRTLGRGLLVLGLLACPGCLHRSDLYVWALDSALMGPLLALEHWPGIVEPQAPTAQHAAELARVQREPHRPYAWDLTLEVW